MNKSVIKTGRVRVLGLSSSSSDQSDNDVAYRSSHHRRINRFAPKRGRGRPPKLKRPPRNLRKSLADSATDSDEFSNCISPQLPAKRGRPRLRPLGIQLPEDEDSQTFGETEEGLFDRVGKRRRRGGRVVD